MIIARDPIPNPIKVIKQKLIINLNRILTKIK
jgi:hypothetical protein